MRTEIDYEKVAAVRSDMLSLAEDAATRRRYAASNVLRAGIEIIDLFVEARQEDTRSIGEDAVVMEMATMKIEEMREELTGVKREMRALELEVEELYKILERENL